MVEIKSTEIYKCDICGKEYNCKREAEECEVRDKEKKDVEQLERTTEFTIAKNHLKLLKEMYVGWDECEFGAPYIDPKCPYGNSDVIDDIAEIIGIKKSKTTIDYDEDEAKEYDNINDYFEEAEWSDKTYKDLSRLHREMQIVLQIILVTGKIKEGNYLKNVKYDTKSWKQKQ